LEGTLKREENRINEMPAATLKRLGGTGEMRGHNRAQQHPIRKAEIQEGETAQRATQGGI
jgi:hypothetical protein